jgi:putative aldouronate transport system substrate-binding protein
MKRGLIVFFSLFLISAFLVACSTKEEASSEKANTKELSSEEIEAIQQGTYKFEEPVTITSVLSLDALAGDREEESFKDNFHTRWALDKLGIKLDYFWAAPAEEATKKLRLMLSSGEKLPGVVAVNDPTLINDLIESGQYRDISEDFATYASPEMQEAYNQEPEQWAEYARGDKKYGIPIFKPVGNDNSLMWVRQDWLDELNLEAPKTLDELEHVLEQFKKQNPGNVDNLVPLGVSLGANSPLVSWFGESSAITGMFGAMPMQWSEEDGKLVYGSIQPEMKDALALLRDWYEKGYINEEAGLHDENKLAELAGAGSVGVVFAPHWAHDWPFSNISKSTGNSNAIMKPYPLPTNNGESGARGAGYYFSGIMVHKDFQHPDALFLYLNRLFEAHNPEPGSEFEHGYAEGYDYVLLEDGTASTNPEDFPEGQKPIQVAQYFLTANAQLTDPFFNGEVYKKLASGAEPSTPAEMKLSNKCGELCLEANTILHENLDIYERNDYLGPPTKTQLAKGQVLDKMENETFLNIIYGRSPIDEFDNFIKQWKNAGGTDVVGEVNKFYQEMK